MNTHQTKTVHQSSIISTDWSWITRDEHIGQSSPVWPVQVTVDTLRLTQITVITSKHLSKEQLCKNCCTHSATDNKLAFDNIKICGKVWQYTSNKTHDTSNEEEDESCDGRNVASFN